MSATILIVEDEQALADAYVHWLEDDFEVRIATDGDAAIDCLASDIDVVLLDRRLPKRSGDDVLEILNRRYSDCRVAMISAIDPDVDIIEMEFDDYLVKPVKREELRSAVDRLLNLSDYDDRTQRLYALLSKQDALEGAMSSIQLDQSEVYQDFKKRLERLKTQMNSHRDDTMDTSSDIDVLPWEQ